MKQIIILICLNQIFFSSNCQNRNANWCFGDSCGIIFTGSGAQTFQSSVNNRGSCCSVSDSSGVLKFYATTGNMNYFPWDCYQTNTWNSNGNLIANGDTIYGDNWYHELLIVPFPTDTQKYYLFSLNVLCQFGISYSILNMSLNGGNGGVTLKNHQIATGAFVDASVAVKHGNGRDWWFIVHLWQTNSFYIYLITPSGISTPSIQNIGVVQNQNLANYVYSHSVNKLLVTNYWGLIEVFDFDRCSGSLSLYQTVSPENLSLQKRYFGSSISPSGHYMYVSNTDNIFSDSLRLDQYDLTAPNIAASKINIYTAQVPCSGGSHALAPDGKIYMSGLYEEGFPYSDTTHNIYTDNLSVINSPDSPGLACNFQPFSFYLGGNRCYWGLPNNPNYDLGRDSGSVCDTLQWTGINSSPTPEGGEIKVFYQNDLQKVFINAHGIKGGKYKLRIFNTIGKLVYEYKGVTTPPYFSKDVDLSFLSNGLYIVNLETEKEVLSGKLLKN